MTCCEDSTIAIPTSIQTGVDISGTFTCYYESSTIINNLFTAIANSDISTDDGYVLDMAYFSPSSIKSLVLEVSDNNDSLHYTKAYTGVVITEIKVIAKVKELVKLEVSFVAQDATNCSSYVEMDNYSQTLVSFADVYAEMYFADSSSLILTTSSVSIDIRRSVSKTHVIGSSNIILPCDSDYVSVTANLQFYGEAYDVANKLNTTTITSCSFVLPSNYDIMLSPAYIMSSPRTNKVAGVVETSMTLSGGTATSLR